MSQSGPTAALSYRPEIDGLRCIAVMAVILFHAGLTWFSGGYVGVDVFFVISGYLITGILLKEKQAGTYTLKGFYERRIRRILPALFAVCAVTVPLCAYVMLPGQMKDFSQSLIATFLFISNIYFYKTDNYFDANVDNKPLLHTWTLSVEEQFYIFFPLLLMVFWRIGTVRLLWLFIVLAFLSLGLSEALAHHGQKVANFFFSPTRGWEFLIGSIIAALELNGTKTNRNIIANNILSAAGIALIAAAVVLFDNTTPFPGIWALIPVTGAALIIHFSHGTLTGRLLSLKPVVAIGLISYSAYLWHQPLFVLARIVYEDQASIPVLLAVTMALSLITWKYVEQPFRRKAVYTRKQIFAFGIAGSLFFIAVGGIGHATGGFEKLYRARLSAEQASDYQMIERALATGGYDAQQDNKDCHFWSRDLDDAFIQRFNGCAEKYKKAVFVLGDSHAMDLYNALALNAANPFVVSVSQGACPAHATFANCPYKTFSAFAEKNKGHLSHIIYTQSGMPLLSKDKTTDMDHVHTVQAYLESLPANVTVLWLGPQIQLGKSVQNLNILRHAVNTLPAEDVVIPVDETLKSANRDKTFAYISKIDAVNFSPQKDLVINGNITYSDKDHWSTFGEEAFGKRLLSVPAIEKALR